MIRVILSLFVFFGMTVAAAADGFEAGLETSAVTMGETFYLNVSYEGQNSLTAQPDFGVLQKEFDIVSTFSSSQINIINGRRTQRLEWKLGLQPKKTGVLTIPALKAGQYETAPLPVEVSPAGSSVKANTVATVTAAGKNTSAQTENTVEISADLAADTKTPYLQQEINAVLTITDPVGLQLTAEPVFQDSGDWIIKSLGKPSVSQKSDGTREIKFRYALFPQKSGVLEIPSVSVNGFYMSYEHSGQKSIPSLFGSHGLNGFFQLLDMDVDFDSMFGTQKPVSLQTEPVTVKVRPADASFQGSWWLPAESVTLAAAWDTKKPLFKAGETVAREITLKAVGVADTQLPEIQFNDDENFRIYPENPQYSSSVNGNYVVSEAVIRVVYIPQRGGEMQLPEIRVPWFNVTSGKTETAVVPAQKIFVEGGSFNAPAVNTPADMPEKETVRENNVENEPVAETYLNKNNMIFIILAAFAAGIICCLLLFRFLLHSQNDKKVKTSSGWADLIAKNLENKDYRTLRDNLLKWGNETFRNRTIANLNDLAECLDNEKFSEQMQILNGVLYGGSADIPDGRIILETVKNYRGKNGKDRNDEILPNLYK